MLGEMLGRLNRPFHCFLTRVARHISEGEGLPEVMTEQMLPEKALCRLALFHHTCDTNYELFSFGRLL